MRPRYMTPILEQKNMTTLKSCEISRNVKLRSSWSDFSKLRTCAATETSSAETGSSATTNSGSTVRARAITALWRCPPLSSYGKRSRTPERPAAKSSMTARRAVTSANVIPAFSLPVRSIRFENRSFAASDVDGLQLCRAIKRSRRLAKTRVVITTSVVDSGQVPDEVLHRHSADGYIEKPIDTRRLHRMLRERQVRACLADGLTDAGAMVARIYGALPDPVSRAAHQTVEAHLEKIREDDGIVVP